MENSQSQNTLEALKWRYATKVFDSTKKLTDDELSLLLDAVQLSPSSYGLQPYQIIVVNNQEIKEQLKAAAYGQPQLADASHIFVFAIEKNYSTEHVDKYADNIIKTRGIQLSDIQGFVDTMKGTVNSLTEEQLAAWNTKQAYIALGFLMESAALNKIDACPMEGFENTKFDEILGLEHKNLTSVVISPVGFRSSNDDYQHYKKVRKSKEDLFIHI